MGPQLLRLPDREIRASAAPGLQSGRGRRVRLARGRAWDVRLCRIGGLFSDELVVGERMERLGGERMGRAHVAHAIGIEREVAQLALLVARADEREAAPPQGEARRGAGEERALGAFGTA